MKNFELRHHVDFNGYKPYLTFSPAGSWQGVTDSEGEYSHVSTTICFSVSDAIALRDDLTAALIAIDAWQSAHNAEHTKTVVDADTGKLEVK